LLIPQGRSGGRLDPGFLTVSVGNWKGRKHRALWRPCRVQGQSL